MSRMRYINAYILLLTLIISCSGKDSEVILYVDAFESPEENLQLARDLTFYDYSQDLALQIDNLELNADDGIDLSAIETESGKIGIKLSLRNKAIPLKQQIKKGLQGHIEVKLGIHTSKKELIDAAEKQAGIYLKLILSSEIRELWKHSSVMLQKHATVADFEKEIAYRQAVKSDPNSPRQLVNRTYTNELHGITGEIFTITYALEDRTTENITVLLNNDSLKFLGYAYQFAE